MLKRLGLSTEQQQHVPTLCIHIGMSGPCVLVVVYFIQHMACVETVMHMLTSHVCVDCLSNLHKQTPTPTTHTTGVILIVT